MFLYSVLQRNLCTFTLFAAFVSSHKVLWRSDINQVAGWLAAEAVSLWSGLVETPHVLILSCPRSTCLLAQACLFRKQCLASQCHRLIHDTYTHTHTHAHAQRNSLGSQWWLGVFRHNVLDPYWFLALVSLIDSSSKRKSENLPLLAVSRKKNSSCIMTNKAALFCCWRSNLE